MYQEFCRYEQHVELNFKGLRKLEIWHSTCTEYNLEKPYRILNKFKEDMHQQILITHYFTKT